MVQGVADLWGRDADGEEQRLVSPEQLRTQLAQACKLFSTDSVYRAWLHASLCPRSAACAQPMVVNAAAWGLFR